MNTQKCPRCGQHTQLESNPSRPFCSERCKLIDLGRWVSGTYRIPVNDAQDGQSAPPEQGEEGREP